MKTLTVIRIGIALLAVVLLTAAFFWLRGTVRDSHVDMGSESRIDLTPTQIQSIKAIGEWEFLSISAEEMVDTVRKGFFSNDELVRIFYGTLRLGVNMHHVEPGWLEADGDSVSVTLPPIGLLDKDFIDEARTKAFYESGSWKPADREALYKRAYQRMLRHCLTPENLQTAETNARLQMENMMRAMGYQKVVIRWNRQERKTGE